MFLFGDNQYCQCIIYYVQCGMCYIEDMVDVGNKGKFFQWDFDVIQGGQQYYEGDVWYVGDFF